jgi:glycosyltransferase involved in cell wall biosynthesis
MRIGIDVRCLVEGRRTGIEEYTLNLLKNIFEVDSKNEYVLFWNSFRKPKTKLKWIKKYSNVSVKKFNYPNKLLNFCFWYLKWPKIDQLLGGVDVVFFPNIIFGSVSKKAKVIVTMHDLSFERHAENFSLVRKLWHVFVNPKEFCRRADKIIAVSQSTKNDLVSLYGVRKEKISVIHSGVDSEFTIIDRNDHGLLKVKNKFGLPYKFILYFGTIEPRKNVIGLIRAFNALQDLAISSNNSELEKFSLVIAGQSGWLSAEIYQEIRRSKYNEKIRIINSVPNKDKRYIFNLASLFVYPSFFEGFGFPPLEAMSCGIPVITSNSSSLPEIVGRAAVMIDPHKPDEIFQAMREILLSRELYEKLKKDGLQQAEKFKWKKTAMEFLKIVKEM